MELGYYILFKTMEGNDPQQLIQLTMSYNTLTILAPRAKALNTSVPCLMPQSR